MFVLTTLVSVAVAAVLSMPAAGSTRCLSAPVLDQTVRAGPFTGYITPAYDVVGGRFRLHIGDYRDRAAGLTQKIPWFAPVRSGVNVDLLVTWTRLSPRPARRFTVHAPTGGIFPQGYVYPTSFSPPSAGCWRLTFHSGKVTATLIVLVRGRG